MNLISPYYLFIYVETGWSQPLDIWGVACILMEMYTGHTIFRSSYDAEQLALWERTLGPIPEYLLDQTNGEKQNWFSKGRLRHPPHLRPIYQQPKLRDMFHPGDKTFHNLISHMLRYDPKQRITAKEALNHPFFTSYRECTCHGGDSDY